MSDRKRKEAMLTNAQREFLRGEKEYEGKNAKQQRYQMRERIARRVRDTLLDFGLLYETFDEHERDRLFDMGRIGSDEKRRKAYHEFQESLVDTIAFLYLGLEGTEDTNIGYRRDFSVPFETILKTAVSKAEVARQPRAGAKTNVIVEFGVDVKNSQRLDTGYAIDKIAEGRPYELTESEMRAVLWSFDSLLGTRGDNGYTELEKRVQERRDEIGFERAPPLPEEERYENDGTNDE